ncbi:pyridoxal-dependent decarboxylase [Celerinatantimonas sp. MCCC 1A17872]|uniref:pyridoxal-dependent decarboxylase n=1 Tax=Celerinatantimonas sp. MCCC 1A17872 TaxID=3177514 RepID=UPI0038CA3528
MEYDDRLYISGMQKKPNEIDEILADFAAKMAKVKDNFLGYQTNQQVYFPESLFYFLTLNLLNLGDSFEQGSYQINTKEFERAVIHYYARLCGFCNDESQRQYWGYITAMGSTEGNLFALWNARDFLLGRAGQNYSAITQTNKEPVVICSAATHYSIYKCCQILNLHAFNDIGPQLGKCPINDGDWSMPIAVDCYGSVDETALYDLVCFFAQRDIPIILIFNHGTTFSGGSDPVYRIIEQIKPILGINESDHRRYWIHVDGALGANFSAYLNQDDPFIYTNDPYEFRHPEVMSLCLSPYKWLGAPWTCGAYLMQERYKAGSCVRPDYVAGRDSTVAGSRQGIYALYLWERLVQLGTVGLKAIATDNEAKTQYLETKLNELAKKSAEFIVMPRQRGANIVRFYCPDEAIRERFSLAQEKEFIDGKSVYLSHVVVLSHVTYAMLDELIAVLSDAMDHRETQPQLVIVPRAQRVISWGRPY